MELSPYSDFAKLRLDDFCSADIKTTKGPNWEWEGGLWYCDSIGFTSFTRHIDTPEETGGLEIQFSEIPKIESDSILSHINLPLCAGMDFETVTKLLGAPFRTLEFADDRKTYEFRAGSKWPYRVSCTVQDDDGLIFVSVIREDVLFRIEGSGENRSG